MVFNIFRKGDQKSEEAVTVQPDEGLAGLLRYIVVRMVDNPDDVQVRQVEGDTSTILELKVNEDRCACSRGPGREACVGRAGELAEGAGTGY